MSFSSIFFNGDEYNQMWINNYLVWQKVDDGDVPLPSDDAYPTYDLVISYSGTNDSYGSAYYTDTFPNKLDDSLEYIDSFSYWAWNGHDVSGTAKLKNVKFYGKTTTKTEGLGSFTLSYTLLKVSAPSSATDLSYLCYRISDETDIRFIRTKNATDMNNMFYQASVTSLDLSAFRTSNVTTMDNMFYSCMYLTDLNIFSFDTSNVEDMSYMFYYCPKLTSLNLSHFNTENVTDMNNMFYNCNGLTDLKLTNFNTSKVTNMSDMFNGCSKLKTLDLTSFDTSSVVNYEDMFLNVSDCTIYISGGWTLGTDATFGGGTNLNFVLINPITSITLESTLTDTSIAKGTIFTITPIAIPTNHTDEIVVTYDSNYLSKDGDTFTVLDTATVGQELVITYSSKYDSSINTVYAVTIRDIIPISSITLTHTLETLTDVLAGTTFVVEPTILPTIHDDELLIDYDINYLSMTDNQFTVLNGASSQTVQIIYYSKLDNSVNAIIEFSVAKAQETVLTYDTFNSVAQTESRYLTFTKDETENTMTMQCAYYTSNYYENSLYVRTDVPLPKKATVKITGETKANIYRANNNGYYPNNAIAYITPTISTKWVSASVGYVPPSDGIVYTTGNSVSSALETYEGAKYVHLFQTNPYSDHLYSDGLTFYPFDYNFQYEFDTEPKFFLFCTTNYGNYQNSLRVGNFITYKDLKIEVHIKHCASIDLVSDIEDLTNVTQSTFTITPNILPIDAQEDIVIEYDTNYMCVIDNKVILLNGSQGKTLGITYRGKYSNVSKTLTFTVAQDVELPTGYELDFTQSIAPTYPSYFEEVAKNSSYYFQHRTLYYSSSYYALTNNVYGGGKDVWTCFKVTAPYTGTVDITHWRKCYSSSYPFVIHVTSDAIQPTYSSSTNRVFSGWGTTYATKDNVTTIPMVAGQEYYIHFQYHSYNSYNYGVGIRKITFNKTE